MQRPNTPAFSLTRRRLAPLLAGGQYACTHVLGTKKIVVDLRNRPEPYEFVFDWVLPETSTQAEVFDSECASASPGMGQQMHGAMRPAPMRMPAYVWCCACMPARPRLRHPFQLSLCCS